MDKDILTWDLTVMNVVCSVLAPIFHPFLLFIIFLFAVVLGITGRAWTDKIKSLLLCLRKCIYNPCEILIEIYLMDAYSLTTFP